MHTAPVKKQGKPAEMFPSYTSVLLLAETGRPPSNHLDKKEYAVTVDPAQALRAAGRAELWLHRALSRPLLTIAALSSVALGIEICQQWPEFLAFGHAIGEFLRNLAYALVGAVLFNWVLIEVPAQRRRRIVYPRHQLGLQFLVQSGPLMLAYYRGAATLLKAEISAVDGWDQSSIETYVRSIYRAAPGIVQERRRLLAIHIHGIQVTLDGLEAA